MHGRCAIPRAGRTLKENGRDTAVVILVVRPLASVRAALKNPVYSAFISRFQVHN